MNHVRAFALVAALAWPIPLHAQLPQAASEVPVPPGAVAVEPGSADFGTVGSQDYDRPIEILEQGRLTWQIETAPEEVFRFYRERIPSTERSPDADWVQLAAGHDFAAFHQIMAHDLQREGDGEVHSGAQIRAALVAAGRRPVAHDVYVQNAEFLWSVHGPGAGEHIDFMLQITDDGLFYTDHDRTALDLQWTRYLAGDDAEQYAEAEEDRERDQAYAETSGEMAGAPSVEELGVGAYAGARYDGELSAGMSAQDEARNYVFFTDDDPEAVRTFYESETGRSANDLGGGTYVISIEGSSLMPDHGVMIAPTAGTPYASRGATMLMVRRTRR